MLLLNEKGDNINAGVSYMRGKTKKATFNLPIDVLTELDEIITQGIAPSKNALVEQALLKELKELRRQARQALWQEAAKDSLFMKDIEKAEVDFRYADAEAARRMG
jgi:metal-responsive CopG/Arc/MetJ family transcriptional regulator